jgi:hypothetical protein
MRHLGVSYHSGESDLDNDSMKFISGGICFCIFYLIVTLPYLGKYILLPGGRQLYKLQGLRYSQILKKVYLPVYGSICLCLSGNVLSALVQPQHVWGLVTGSMMSETVATALSIRGHACTGPLNLFLSGLRREKYLFLAQLSIPQPFISLIYPQCILPILRAFFYIFKIFCFEIEVGDGVRCRL